MANVSIEGWHCEVCGHDWKSRRPDKPVRCAKCKTPYWDRSREDVMPNAGTSNAPNYKTTTVKPAVVRVPAKASKSAESTHGVTGTCGIYRCWTCIEMG